MRILATLLACGTLAACAGGGPPPDRAGQGVAGPAAEAARPRLDLLPPGDATALETALAGRVLVARRTDGDAVLEAAYYGGDSRAVRRRAGGAALDRFRWSLGTRSTPRGGYAFLSRDGSSDGAALSYWPDRHAVSFSDGDLGPYFSAGVIAECWPRRSAGPPPAGVRACAPAAEAAVLADVDAEAARALQRRRAADGRLTTRVGAVYRNSLGNTLTVTAVRGLDIEFSNQRGDIFRSRALLYGGNPRVIGDDKVYEAVASLFPLAPGKRAEAWVYNAEWSWQLAWTVKGKETVRVPAGTVEAWRIEQTETSLGGNYVGRATIWYAPSLGWTAKWRGWTETDPSAPVTEWTLVEARLPAA